MRGREVRGREVRGRERGRKGGKGVCTDAWGQDEGGEMAMGKRACKHFVYDTKYAHTCICKVVP